MSTLSHSTLHNTFKRQKHKNISSSSKTRSNQASIFNFLCNKILTPMPHVLHPPQTPVKPLQHRSYTQSYSQKLESPPARMLEFSPIKESPMRAASSSHPPGKYKQQKITHFFAKKHV